MSLPAEVLSEPPELPAEVSAAADTTKKILRKASMEFHGSNPYVPMVTRGSVYLPPEAKLKYGDKSAEEEKEDQEARAENSDDDDEEEEQVAAQKTLAREEGLAGMDVDLRTFRFDQESASWVYSVPWHTRIVPDDSQNPKHVLPNGDLKPRRPMPQIRATHLLQGLKFVDGRYFLPGMLNEWPALQGLMLASITRATKGWVGMKVQRLWTAQEGKNGKQLPQLSELNKDCRATFLAPEWSAIGWAPKSPGFVFWFSQQHEKKPRVIFGEKMMETLQEDATRSGVVTRCHNYVHKYPVAKETMQDRITWHALTVAEWSHGQFVTILELAFLNAVGGYGGKANWVEDKLDPNCSVWTAMKEHHGMIQPWNESQAEIRIYDVPVTTMAGFEAYLEKYTSTESRPLPMAEQRFVKWECTHSARCKMRNCTAEVLASYQINYIRRVWRYAQLTNNCQHFNTDLFAFLTGERDIRPYGTMFHPGYTQRMKAFLFMPTQDTMFEGRGARKNARVVGSV